MKPAFPNVGIVLTTRSVLGREPSLSKVIETLSGLNRLSALQQCALWSRDDFMVRNVHSTWKADEEHFRQFLNDVIPMRLHGACLREFRSSDFEFVSPFTEVGLLALIGLVCRFSLTAGGQQISNQPSRWKLFCALLHLQTEQMPTAILALNPKDQFPLVTRMVLANQSTQNRWGYDMGRLHALVSVPEVGRFLSAHYGEMTVADWFQKRLGIAAGDYEVITNVQFGAAVYGADFNVLCAQQARLAPSILRLCQLATQTLEELAQRVGPLTSLRDAQDYADYLMLRPLLRVESGLLLTSLGQLFNKFHRGLPYLVVESGRVMGCTDVKRLRGEFGDIFQGYVSWLMASWFSGSDVRVISSYWVRGGGLCGTKGDPCEKDLLILHQDVAYVFEIKASVPTLAARRGCRINELKEWLLPVTKQAYHAAQGLVQGNGFLDQQMRQPIPAPKRAYPCGVTFEFNPLRFLYSDHFQRALEFDLGVSVFSDFPRVAPMQYFDIQQIEMWDDLVDLPASARDLFKAIQCRAEQPDVRYASLRRQIDFRQDYAERPGRIRSLIDEAEAKTTRRLAEFKAS